MFCKTCDCLVCPECISGGHKRHDFESIDIVGQEKSQAVQELHSRLSEYMSICKPETSTLAEVKQERKLHYDLATMNINTCELELIKLVHSYADGLRNDIENEREAVMGLIKERDSQFKVASKTLEPLSTKICGALATKRADKIISCASEFEKGFPTFSFTKIPSYALNFRQGKRSMNFDKAFGSLARSEVTNKEEAQLKFSVIKSFTTNQKYVDPMTRADEEMMWICDSESVTLKKVAFDGNVDIRFEKSIKAIDIAMTRRNELLLSVESDIKLLSKTGELKTFLSVSPLLARGLHVTDGDELLVGLRESGDPTQFNDKSCRKVVTYGMDGKEKQSYEFDKHGKRLFTVPVRITSSARGNIVICDHKSTKVGRVVSLSKLGEMKWSYDGNPVVNSFYPKGVVITSSECVIVTDLFNHGLHVLSDGGQLLNFCTLVDQGCQGPLSLAMDDEETLWVGCSASHTQSNAKLHLLKIGWA